MAGTLKVGGVTLATHSDATGLVSMDNNIVMPSEINNTAIGSNVTFPPLGSLAVGTVSESSGTPTGAIMESGSNSNGYYVKFADGTMICGATGRTSNTTYNYPASFVSTPHLVSMLNFVNSSGTLQYRYISVAHNDSTSFKIGYVSGAGNDNIIAIGRWYT